MTTTDNDGTAELVELPTSMSVETSLYELGQQVRKLSIEPCAVYEDSSFLIERVRSDETVQVQDLEGYLDRPRRQRGSVTVHDWSDFAQLVNRLVDPYHTTVWCNADNGTFTAVFDDHGAEQVAGWRSHTATLKLKADPDWELWLKANNQLMTQEQFALFLEDVAHTVVDPDAATLLEVATTFRATKKADYKGGVRLDNGDVEFSYQEQTTSSAGGKSGKLEIPQTFTVRIAPWRGVDPVDLTARLRYRLTDGQLGIGFSLLRPDRAKDDAFEGIHARLREQIDADAPMFQGVAPQPVS
jgi:uncharacterized protein YfdQ (DUF2303 family)